jgi:hypothetical protein
MPAQRLSMSKPEVAGCLTTRLIVKVPHNPGMTYVGSITLPFHDFSYVLKHNAKSMA